MNESLDTKLVTDWREVLPVVTPFYERFFGEKIPEDLDVEMGHFRGNKKGDCDHFTGKIRLGIYPLDEVADTFIHESTHRLFENESGIGKIHWNDIKKMSCTESYDKALFELYERVMLRNRFLHECVACTVESLFVYSDYRDEEVKELIHLVNKSYIKKLIDYYDAPDSNIVELRTGIRVSSGYMDQVGIYLAAKHRNDSELWSKLKQLRTLDDLKKLVEV